MTKSIGVPLATTIPADGFCADTRLAGTIGSGAWVTVPDLNPASMITCRASDKLLFLRSGTGTLSADVATLTLTSPPVGISVPTARSWNRIVPTA